MRPMIIIILCSILANTESSKCPESRKPHPTSCTIFYNCVSLPGGGYVWVPSKCTDGLIFQPYLRTCVLPGDTWTCDTLATESPSGEKGYEVAELINANETSYMGSTEDPPNFFEAIDSSHTTDSIPEGSDQEMATPFPVIEIEESVENKYVSSDNSSETNEDYLRTENEKRRQLSMLNRLIRHLLIYKGITIPLDVLASSSLSSPTRTISNTPLSNYHIQNYIQQNTNLQNTIISGAKFESSTEWPACPLDGARIESMASTDRSNEKPKDQRNTYHSILDDLDDENNIILIKDNIGNKQYMSTEKYKSLGYHLDAQFVHVIPCIKNVRMPNITNCFKYYVCNPEVATVIEYSCPQFAAFNKYARTCDSESYGKCKGNKDSGDLEVPPTSVSVKNICTEHGKTRDPTSESRYYICHSATDNSQAIKSIRMTCPNGLIFCQSKKVCTTRRLCKIT